MGKLQKKYLIANWKMNPFALDKAEGLFRQVATGVKPLSNTEVVICPPFLYISRISHLASRISYFKLGAQDCFWKQEGAYTGETSPSALKDAGCQYVILGHSERRKYLKETISMVQKKVKASLEADLTPIICIGDKKRSPADDELVEKAVKKVASGFKKALFVYEPVWAISSENGSAPTIKEAKKGRELIEKSLGNEKATILYGGSVDSQNALSHLKAGFDGLLVGRASLRADEFVKIAQAVDGFRPS